MESLDIKLRPKRRFCFLPQLQDLQHADLVNSGLTWPDDVSESWSKPAALQSAMRLVRAKLRPSFESRRKLNVASLVR